MSLQEFYLRRSVQVLCLYRSLVVSYRSLVVSVVLSRYCVSAVLDRYHASTVLYRKCVSRNTFQEFSIGTAVLLLLYSC